MFPFREVLITVFLAVGIRADWKVSRPPSDPSQAFIIDGAGRSYPKIPINVGEVIEINHLCYKSQKTSGYKWQPVDCGRFEPVAIESSVPEEVELASPLIDAEIEAKINGMGLACFKEQQFEMILLIVTDAHSLQVLEDRIAWFGMGIAKFPASKKKEALRASTCDVSAMVPLLKSSEDVTAKLDAHMHTIGIAADKMDDYSSSVIKMSADDGLLLVSAEKVVDIDDPSKKLATEISAQLDMWQRHVKRWRELLNKERSKEEGMMSKAEESMAKEAKRGRVTREGMLRDYESDLMANIDQYKTLHGYDANVDAWRAAVHKSSEDNEWRTPLLSVLTKKSAKLAKEQYFDEYEYDIDDGYVAYQSPRSHDLVQYDEENVRSDRMVGRNDYDVYKPRRSKGLVQSDVKGHEFENGIILGSGAIIAVVVVFCIGLAFGMVLYWGCTQKREEEVKMYRHVDEEE
eukprot:269636_1